MRIIQSVIELSASQRGDKRRIALELTPYSAPHHFRFRSAPCESRNQNVKAVTAPATLHPLLTLLRKLAVEEKLKRQ